MIVAVNTRLLLKDKLEGIGYFTREVLTILTQNHPEHQFYFFFDRPYSEDFVFNDNVYPLVISPPTRHPLLWKYWYDIKVPLALKKIKADVFVSPDGFSSLTSGVRQCLVIHDLGFLHQPDSYKKSHYRYYKYFTPKFIKKAKTIATVSEFSKNDIIKQYKTDAKKIQVVYNGVKDVFHPASFDEQLSSKAKYTGGKEFFLYVGAIQPRKNLVNLLKAFSIFKKRQKSEWKLVLAGKLGWRKDEFRQLLKSYRYKHDVVLTGYVQEKELVELVGASYAMIYPSFFEGFGVPLLEGMKSHVPVLTSAGTSMQEIGEDAALYFNPKVHTDIADKLMLIYKDENLRQSLIEKGKIVAQKYTWKRSADLLWQSIMEATKR